jgi:hypothetical protein
MNAWFKGLIAAAVGGVGNGLTLAIVDPSHFTIHSPEGLLLLGKVALAGAIVAVAGYLKQSPLFKGETS